MQNRGVFWSKKPDMTLAHLALKIGTNYVPSDEEVAHIKDSILPASISNLSELNVGISRVQELYTSLTEQRQDVLTQIEGYRDLMSPARRLPIDLLQEIFIHTLPKTHNALMDASECPILLTRICSRWRSISLSTPHLWSTIHIPVPRLATNPHRQIGLQKYMDLPGDLRTSIQSSLKNYAAAVASWLGKSGASPLCISVYDSRDYFIPREHYDVIIDSLLPFAHRWKELVLIASSPSLNRIAELTESDVPLLESLALHDTTISDPSSDPPLVWKTSGIVKAHRLQKINYIQVSDNITHFSLKWAQLTDIKLTQILNDWGPPADATLSDIILVLSLSPRLITFHSEIGLHPTTGINPPASISSLPLLNLQKLVFNNGGANCNALFDLLEVPSLLHLEFLPTDCASHRVLSTFLPQTAGTILSLTTTDYFFYSYRSVLSQCQKLTSITIKLAPSLGPTADWAPTPVDFIEDVLLESFTLPIGHPDRLAPALEVFDCRAGGNFSDAAVLNFIKAKQSRTDITKLKRISIAFTRAKESSVPLDEEVAQYVADGLVVNLSYRIGLDGLKVRFAFRANVGI